MNETIISVLSALGLTLILEGIIYLIFKRKELRFWIAFIVFNILTNVPLNIIMLSWKRINVIEWSQMLAALEIAVVIIEFAGFKLIERNKKGLFVEVLLANLFSFSLGSLLLNIIV
jgi:hypothetical protein